MKYKAVIFDFDDTLVESRAVIWSHHKHTAKEFYDIDLTDEEIRKHWGKPQHTLLQELYRGLDTVENIVKNLLAGRDGFKKNVFPDAPIIMRELIKEDVKVGILTSTNRDFLMRNLMEFEFPVEEMTVIQTAEETDVHKPNPAVFSPILTRLEKEGIKPEEVVYIGDSIDDLLAAKGAGVNFIAVTTGLYSEENFRKEGADAVVRKLGDIRELI